jgi:hypothetical protein
MAVYIAALGFENEYKVGYSGDWRRRLMSLRTANRHIKPILVIEGSGEIENELHKGLSSAHLEREIFMLDQDALDLVVLTVSIFAAGSNLRCLYMDDDVAIRWRRLIKERIKRRDSEGDLDGV